jgi:hypothetical protein
LETISEIDICEYLLNAGVSHTVIDREDQSFLQYAIGKRQYSLIIALIRYVDPSEHYGFAVEIINHWSAAFIEGACKMLDQILNDKDLEFIERVLTKCLILEKQKYYEYVKLNHIECDSTNTDFGKSKIEEQ